MLEEAGIDAATNTRRPAAIGREARQRAVFDSAMDFAMILTDRDGIITDWNPGAEQVLGWTQDEMVGQSAERFFTPEDVANDRIEHEMQLALSVGRASDERWHLRKGGQLFWASGEMMPLYDEKHTHLGFVKILRDRTPEHLAGRATEEAQERHRLAAKATNDAIWDWDFAANRCSGTTRWKRPTATRWQLWTTPVTGGWARSIPTTVPACTTPFMP